MSQQVEVGEAMSEQLVFLELVYVVSPSESIALLLAETRLGPMLGVRA
jgi:hypothetical protein